MADDYSSFLITIRAYDFYFSQGHKHLYDSDYDHVASVDQSSLL